MQIGAGTRALVTGASKGIGLSLSEELARRGATVGMVARSEEELRKRAEPLGAVALPVDVSDATAIREAAAEFAGQAGGIDLVIANAGIARYAPFADQEPADADQMVAINVLWTINTVRAALPYMRSPRPSGSPRRTAGAATPCSPATSARHCSLPPVTTSTCATQSSTSSRNAVSGPRF